MADMGRLLGLIVLAAFGVTAGAGCAARRVAVDYQIKVDREFDTEHVKETDPFVSGEKFRLCVTTHEDCYLYILNRGTSGRYNVLFPHPKINDGDNYVPGWQHVIVPPSGAYQFDATPGVETVIMCVSDKRVPQLEAVVSGQQTDPAQIEQILHELEAEGKHRGSFQKIHHAGHTQVVLESPNPDAMMVNVLRLEHAPQGL